MEVFVGAVMEVAFAENCFWREAQVAEQAPRGVVVGQDPRLKAVESEMVACPVDHLCDTRCAVAVVTILWTPDADAYREHSPTNRPKSSRTKL